MIKETPKLRTFYNKAYAYAVFPKVTKAGIGIGGAAGRGTVFKNHQVVGSSSLKQASIGFQLGGQQYSEVIFFENKKAYDHFINGNLKFDAQASAVAIKVFTAVITSSPGPIPSPTNASHKAEVPLDDPTEYFV